MLVVCADVHALQVCARAMLPAVAVTVAPAPAPVTVDPGMAPNKIGDISVCSYQSNHANEDRYRVAQVGKYSSFTVADGHGGFQAAEFVAETLPGALGAALKETKTVGAGMVRAFEATDAAFIDAITPSFKLGFGEVGHVGACVISAVVDKDTITVANAGDCRAVIGRASGSNAGVIAAELSRDHNARMPVEQERLRREHPGEEDVVMCHTVTSCYVKKRLQPTRSIGDVYLKRVEFNGVRETRLRGRYVPPPFTPPYITSTPEVRVCDGMSARVCKRSRCCCCAFRRRRRRAPADPDREHKRRAVPGPRVGRPLGCDEQRGCRQVCRGGQRPPRHRRGASRGARAAAGGAVAQQRLHDCNGVT